MLTAFCMYRIYKFSIKNVIFASLKSLHTLKTPRFNHTHIFAVMFFGSLPVRFIYLCVIVLLSAGFVSCKYGNKLQISSAEAAPLYQADPTIFYNNHQYYLYGTNGSNADSGFKVFVSKDLKNWQVKKEENGYALIKGDNTFGTKGFWAPQVFTYLNKYFIAYTANEHIAFAESDSPRGLFTQKKAEPLDTSIKQIDPFVFFDNDGKIYLFHVRLQNGNRIYVEELNSDLTVKSNTLTQCISGAVNTQPWENTQSVNWTVTEGPTVIKRNQTYYLFYSANDFRNPDYAVGYATAKTPLGPWKKYTRNPIISRQLLGINGTGHGDIIQNEKGEIDYVFHTHLSNEKVAPRRTAFIQLLFATDGSVSADARSFRYLETTK